jgi:hypothetical protein
MKPRHAFNALPALARASWISSLESENAMRLFGYRERTLRNAIIVEPAQLQADCRPQESGTIRDRGKARVL